VSAASFSGLDVCRHVIGKKFSIKKKRKPIVVFIGGDWFVEIF
jgi:hypothetical protein